MMMKMKMTKMMMIWKMKMIMKRKRMRILMSHMMMVQSIGSLKMTTMMSLITGPM
jgi:hypothetical protein